MGVPTVAVVGRPNVGKSSLFNRLTHTRDALVHPTSGVTRDRIYGLIDVLGRMVHLVDTGGLVPGHEDFMEDHIRDQVDVALAEADLVLFVVDGQAGMTPMDEEVGTVLRRRDLPVLLVVNKVDGHEHGAIIEDFRRLGFDEVIPFSATHGYNTAGILDIVARFLPAPTEGEGDDLTRPLRIAFAGKPNVGKSSLINHLIENERLIVSDVAGTTRESIEVPFRMEGEGRPMVLVDTAGLRRRARVKPGVEKLMRVSTERAIRMADIVVLLIDASEPLSHQDKHIAGLVQKARKPGLLVLNKIDLLTPDEESDLQRELVRWYGDLDIEMAWYHYAPRIPLSAKDGRGVRDLLNALVALRNRFDFRIPTPKLNKLLREALLVHPPPSQRSKQLSILYAHQIPDWPASFTLVVNDPRLVHFSFHRYLENTLRQYGDFEGFPVVLKWQKRGEGKKARARRSEAILEAERHGAAAAPPVEERTITRVPRRRKAKKKGKAAKVVRTPSAPLKRRGKDTK